MSGKYEKVQKLLPQIKEMPAVGTTRKEVDSAATAARRNTLPAPQLWKSDVVREQFMRASLRRKGV